MDELPHTLDPEFLIQTLDRHRPLLLETADRFTSAFAEDCVQEATLKALNSKDSFRGKTLNQLLGWVRKIVIHECLSKLRLRGNQQRTGISNLEMLDASQSTPSRLLRMDEELNSLDAALEKLTQRERDAIIYRYLVGLSLDEIAGAMEATKGAVAGLLKRGLEKLGSTLRESRFSILLNQ